MMGKLSKGLSTAGSTEEAEHQGGIHRGGRREPYQVTKIVLVIIEMIKNTREARVVFPNLIRLQ